MSTGTVRGVMLPERGLPAAADVVSVPAVVGFRGGKVAVGEPALMMAAVVPDTILPGPVRLLGRKADDPIVRRYAERFRLEAKLSKGELRWIPEDEPKDPGLGAVEAMTAIFEHVLEMLDRARERHAVVAIPPWLNDAGRSQLVRAAAQAKITVRRFVSRPIAIAVSLAGDRQLLGRGMVIDGGAGGIAAALVEGRSRSVSLESSASRDTAGADDVAAEIVRSVAPEDANRQTRELLRQGADAVMRTLADKPLADRSVETPSGKLQIRLEPWELDLLMGPAGHDLATVLAGTQSGKRRLPTWFSGPLSAHRVLRSTASEKAQGPLRHVDDAAAALGAAQVMAMVEGKRDDLTINDGESVLAPPGRASRSERASAPPREPETKAASDRRHHSDTFRPPTNTSVKDVATKRTRASTRRLSPEERAKRRRERSLKVREAQKGPLPTRGGKASSEAAEAASESSPDAARPSDPSAPPEAARTSSPGAPPAASPEAPSEAVTSTAARSATPRPKTSPSMGKPATPAAEEPPAADPAPQASPIAEPNEPATPSESPGEAAAAPPNDPEPNDPEPDVEPSAVESRVAANERAPAEPAAGVEDSEPPRKAPPTVPAKPRTPTEPARPRVATEPPQPKEAQEPQEPEETPSGRRSVTEPGIPAPGSTPTDSPAVTPPPSRSAAGRPVMSSRGSTGRRPTAPQISLDRGSDPGEPPRSTPRADAHAATEPAMRRLSQPPQLGSAPPRISELPPERSSIKSPDSSAPRPSVPPGGRLSLPPGAIWPRAGTLANPTDAAGILDMAIIRELRDEDLEPVALPVLLRRIIGRANMVGRLKINAGRIEVDVQVQDGCLLLARAEHNALRRAFDEPAGSWSFEAGEPIDAAKHPLAELKKLRTLGLEGLRRMLRHTERADLQATFGHRFEEAPTIHAHKSKHPRRLRLDRREVRAVEQHVDGTSTVRELTQTTGLGTGTTLQVLALLDMFDVLRWPEGDAL